VRLLRSPVRPHALADASGRVSLLAEIPKGASAASLGMLEVAPGIGAVRLAPEDVDAFAALRPGLVLRAPPPRRALLDRSGKWTNVPAFREATGTDGTGVVVGVVDTGLDLTHPDFRNADGSTRVAWLLHAGAPRGLHPELEAAFGCSDPSQTSCVVYAREDIDAMLASGKVPSDVHDLEGHGTHVTSIAAGNGGPMTKKPLKYVGMAPNATLVIASPSLPGRGFADADILNAARFVFDRADAMGLPAVLNLSIGSDYGPHDGTSALEAGLAAMVGDDKPGRAIVVAAGNSGALYQTADGDGPLGIHTEAHASPNAVTRVPILTPAASAGQGFVWVNYRPGDAVSVGLEGPDGSTWVGLTDPGDEAGYDGDGGTTAAVINDVVDGKSTLTADTNGAVVAFDGAWQAGEMTILLQGHGDAQLWVTGQGDVGPSAGSGLLFRRALRQGTINVPASHPSLLAVGCTVNRIGWRPLGSPPIELSTLGPDAPPHDDSLCYFSSAGPTPLGVAKPEIAAPGGFIAAAMSVDADPRKARGGLFDSPGCPDDKPCYVVDDGHAIAAGTSMSAPHVAGAIALLLQKDPNLAQGRISEILQAGARHPSGPVQHEVQLGVGELDMIGALEAMAEEADEPLEPDVAKSWYVLSSGYVRPDPSWPVWGTIELRRADGSIASGLLGTKLALSVTGGVVVQALTKVRQGMWRFAIAGAESTGGGSVRVAVSYDGQPIGETRTLPIGVDAWAATGGVDAVGGGCTCDAAGAGHGGASSVTGLGLAAIGISVSRRRRGAHLRARREPRRRA
jgi:subtilisin family serine protease